MADNLCPKHEKHIPGAPCYCVLGGVRAGEPPAVAEITDEQIAELRRLHEAADRAPWYLVGHPWADGRAADTYAISGSPDPHAGTAVLQWCEVDEVTLGDGDDESSAWLGAEDKQRANLACAVAARNALPALLSRLERAEKDANDAEKALDEHNEASADALELLWQHVIIARKPDYGPWEYPGQAFRHLRDEFNDMAARIATLEKERDEAREEVIGLRGASSGAIEILTEQNDELRARVATLEAQRDEYAEQYGVMGVALTVAERKLSAYVGVCAGDKELTESVLPKVWAALRGLEGK